MSGIPSQGNLASVGRGSSNYSPQKHVSQGNLASIGRGSQEQDQPSGKRYTITHGSNTYTLSQDDVDWIRTAYQGTYDSHYDGFDEDERRRQARVMPLSYEQGYKGDKLDGQLYELGLPAAKYLDNYVTGLRQYRAAEREAQNKQGRISDFYNSVAGKWMQYKADGKLDTSDSYTAEDGSVYTGNQLYQNAFYNTLESSDWDDIRGYFAPAAAEGKTLDDYDGDTRAFREAQITASNKAAKEAAKNADDPSASLSFSYDDFISQYGNIEKAARTKKIAHDAVYGDLTVGDVLDNGQEAGRKAAFSSITDKESAQKYVDSHATDADAYGDMLLDMFSAGLRRDQALWAKDRMVKNAKGNQSAIDSINSSWMSLEEGYTNRNPLLNLIGGILAGPAKKSSDTQETDSSVSVPDAMRLFSQNLTYDQSGNVDSASVNGAIDALVSAGAQPKEIIQATQSVFDGLSGSGSVNPADAADASGNSARKVLDDRLKALRQENLVIDSGGQRQYDLDKKLDAALSSWESSDVSALSADDAKKILGSYIVYTRDGHVDADSFSAGFEKLREAGASAAVIRQVAEESSAADDRSFFQKLGDLWLNSSYQGKAAIESKHEFTIEDFDDQMLYEAERQDRVNFADDLRTELRGQGYTDFEIDQALSRKGWQDTLDESAWAKDYFASVDLPRSLENESGWQALTDEQRAQYADEYWSGMTDEARSDYIASFSDSKDYNTDLHKSYEQQLKGQLSSRFAAAVFSLVSGGVEAADMVSTAITGKPELWKFTNDVMNVQEQLSNNGRVAGQDLTSDVIGGGGDVIENLVRMAVTNKIGAVAGKAVLGLAGVNAATSTAETISGMNILAKSAYKVAETAPFIIPAMGNYYSEAVLGGADPRQAVTYGLVCGSFEGLVEKFNMDKLWGKALGGEKLGAQLVGSANKLLSSGSVVAKARAISLVSSFLGEAGEESASYALSWFMQNAQGWKPGEFDLEELGSSAFVGGLVGLFGSGLSAGSINERSLILDYMTSNNDYSPTNFDLYLTAVKASSMSSEFLQAHTDASEIMPVPEFSSAQLNVAQNTRWLQKADADYSSGMSELEAHKKQLKDAVAAQRKAWRNAATESDRDSAFSKFEQAKKELTDFNRKYESKRQQLESAHSESVFNTNAAIKSSQAKLDAHYAATYSLFREDIDAICARQAAGKTLSVSNSRYEKSAAVIDAMVENGLFDPAAYDAAVSDMGAAAGESSGAEALDGKASEVSANTDEKMRAAKTGKLKEYNAAQTEQTSAQKQQAGEPKFNRVALSQEDRTGVADVCARIGRQVEFRALEPWVDGKYENGKLVLNESQLASDSDGRSLFQTTVYRVLTHELTHTIEGTRAYDQFANFVMDRCIKESGVSAGTLYSWKINQYADMSEGNVRLGLGEARREVVAEWSQKNLLTNEKAIDTIVREQSGLAGRFLNWIQYQIAKTGARKQPNSADALALLKAERLYVKAFAQSGQSPSSGAAQYMLVSDIGIERMRENGFSPFVFTAPDGMARARLSDKDSVFNMDAFNKADDSGSTKLSDILKHDELYKLYPGLADVSIMSFSGSKKSIHLSDDDFAVFSPGDNAIIVHKEKFSDASMFEEGVDPREIILHEVQHYVQYAEGIDQAESIEQARALILLNSFREAEADHGYADLSNAEKIARVVQVYSDKMSVLDDAGDDPAYARYKNSLSENEAFYTEDASAIPELYDNDESAQEFVNEGVLPYDYVAVEKELDAKIKSVGQIGLDNLLSPGYNSRHKNANKEVLQDVALGLRTSGTGTRFGNRKSRKAEESDSTVSQGQPLSYAKEGTLSGKNGGQAASAEQAGLSTQQGAFSFPDSTDGSTMYAVPQMTYEQLAAKYGTIDEGKQPRARDVDVPKQTADDNRVSKFTRSLFESSHVTDELLPNLQQKMLDEGIGTYSPITNEQTRREAEQRISSYGGVAAAQQEFISAVANGVKVREAPVMVAVGSQLIAEASARGDAESMCDLWSSMVILAAETGQGTQAFSMLKELGGLGSGFYMDKLVAKLNRKFEKRIADGKMQPITVDPALMSDLMSAKTVDEINRAQYAISANIGEQIPLTAKEALENWRYFAMLANPVTHIRNITGNATMSALRTGKDAIASALESVAVKNGWMEQSDRTHAVYNKAEQADRIALAESLFPKYENDISGGGKNGFDDSFREFRRQSPIGVVDKLMKFNNRMLNDVEDVSMFMRPAFVSAMTQYMVAQNIDAASITPAQERAAANWAIGEAQRATFRDASALAAKLNQFSNSGPVAHLLVGGVIPFKKTLFNVVKRGVEYSPVGLLNGIKNVCFDVKNGKCTAAQAIDHLSAGIVGSGMYALGAFLASIGVLRAGREDKDAYQTLLEASGEQAYSLNVGDLSFAISNIAPATMPLFMGAELYNRVLADGEEFQLSDLVDIAASVVDPLMEMSFMSSLNEALKSYGRSDNLGGTIGNVALTAARSYAGQFVPTVGGKIEAAFDPTALSAKSDATSILGGTADSWLRTQAKKIPGLAAAVLEPAVNVKGDEVKRFSNFGEWALNFANQFLLPANVRVKDRDYIDEELIRVYKATGNTDMLPTVQTAKYLTVDGQQIKMNASQYARYCEDRGTSVYASIKALITSQRYKSATYENRASMLKKVIEAAEGTVRDTWKEKLGRAR